MTFSNFKNMSRASDEGLGFESCHDEQESVGATTGGCGSSGAIRPP